MTCTIPCMWSQTDVQWDDAPRMCLPCARYLRGKEDQKIAIKLLDLEDSDNIQVILR
jgi:hypothetical protein